MLRRHIGEQGIGGIDVEKHPACRPGIAVPSLIESADHAIPELAAFNMFESWDRVGELPAGLRGD